MSDTAPTPTPEPGRFRPLAAKYGPWAVAVLGWLLAVYLGGPRSAGPIPLPPVQPPPPAFAPGAEPEADRPFVATADGVAPAFGWVRDADTIAANLDPVATEQFDDTPAGQAALGDEDVFLWRAVRKVNDRGPPWYPNINQGSVGCCVGGGFKHGADVCQAAQIVNGRAAEWKPVSVEVIYGGSRVEVGGGRLRGDGSTGRWARDFVTTRGVAPMERYASHDLTAFSPARAREFGRTGVPDDIEAVARKSPVRSAAQVKTWADVKRAVLQGYPVPICSDQGFTMARDRDGFARASGTWAHCMACIGVRSGPREGGFILNSWGDAAHTGPVWPADAPPAGFWADAAVIDRMARQGDSFALSDLVGFPSRKLDWSFTRAAPRGPVRPAELLALAP
jgi:hypothetical protein